MTAAEVLSGTSIESYKFT